MCCSHCTSVPHAWHVQSLDSFRTFVFNFATDVVPVLYPRPDRAAALAHDQRRDPYGVVTHSKSLRPGFDFAFRLSADA